VAAAQLILNRASKFEWKHSRECNRKADRLKQEIGGEAMWKSICSLLMISTACVPAEAAKFSCLFSGNKTPCLLDTQTDGGRGSCLQTYPSPYNVTAVCGGDGNLLFCYFATGSQRPPKLGKNELSSSDNLTKAMAGQQGVRTVAVEDVFSPAGLRLMYSDVGSGFGADVACRPK